MEFVCSACSDSIQLTTTILPLKNKTHGGGVYNEIMKWQSRADGLNLISTQKDMAIHFKGKSAAIILHQVSKHTLTNTHSIYIHTHRQQTTCDGNHKCALYRFPEKNVTLTNMSLTNIHPPKNVQTHTSLTYTACTHTDTLMA